MRASWAIVARSAPTRASHVKPCLKAAAPKAACLAMEAIIVSLRFNMTVGRDRPFGAKAPARKPFRFQGNPLVSERCEFTPSLLIGPTNVCRVCNREFG
jgi:hypothetical protein